MSLEKQKNPEKRASGPKPTEGQDEDYDLYLFWPSLSVSWRDTPSSPLYGPVDFDYSESSGPPSPITFASALDSRFPTELDSYTAPLDSPEAGAEAEPPNEPKTSDSVKYSPIFELGLLLSMTHLVDRAIDGVKIKIRKPRSPAP